MIQGSCCCGAVKFQVALNEQTMMGTCHCSRCRKLGASTILFIDEKSFQLLAGKECIHIYSPEPPFKYNRTFCKKCGTALGGIGSGDAVFPVPANCLDGDFNLSNQFHVFTASKPNWYEICDAAPQFSENPPQ